MSTRSDTTCTECGGPLPPGTQDGLCEHCLIVLGLEAAELAESSGGGAPADDLERLGGIVDRYKLLERIGEGGFGIVYMAEQQQPVRRQVALKIIKAGMDTREVVARFEAERQALALMDHPNIARVFDGGISETGRPFFVMELVRGIAITDFCDQRELSTGDRLRLFIDVCKAVQHAHQKGIIHRDLKPSNILVTLHDGKPVPKIIDFGVAKALGQKLTDKTLFTGFLRLVGTPAYMSPEQAELSGLDVDTRADIYALGVLLYELLTGVTPFDAETLRKAALDEVRRMIRESEPPKPSTRLRTLGDRLPNIAKERHVDSGRLVHLVRGDLDWIVMKCLEKDRRRRYETANALSRDLERHLGEEPVEARPPSTLYRLGKLVRRNKAAIGLTAALLATALVVLGTVIRQAQGEVRRREALERGVREALTESLACQEEERWPQARAAAERARSLASSESIGRDLQGALEERLSDLDVMSTIEDVRHRWANVEDAGFFETQSGLLRDEEVEQIYRETFASLGIELDARTPEQAATWLRSRSITDELIPALDHWALIRQVIDNPEGSRHLLSIAQLLDRVPWNQALRDFLANPDSSQEVLVRLTESAASQPLPPLSVVQLADILASFDMPHKSVEALEAGLRWHRGDFWLNSRLGHYCLSQRDWQGTIVHTSIALGLRPESSATHVRLGVALLYQGRLDDAIAECREAVRLNPRSGPAWIALGGVLHTAASQRADDGLAAQARTALLHGCRLKPEDVPLELVDAILVRGSDVSQVIAELREDVRRAPESSVAHAALGLLQFRSGNLDEAIRGLKRAVQLEGSPSRVGYSKVPGSTRLLILAYETRAFDLACEQRWDEAADDFAQLLAIDDRGRGRASAPRKVIARKLAARPVLFEKVLSRRPDDSSLWVGLAQHHSLYERYSDAAEAYQHAMPLPLWDGELQTYAEVLLLCGQREAYQQLCSESLARENPPRNRHTAGILAYIFSIGPANGVAPETLLEWGEWCQRSQHNDWFLRTLGLIQYRAGNLDEALATLSRKRPTGDPLAWPVLALVNYELGNREEGLDWHLRTLEEIQRMTPEQSLPLEAQRPPEVVGAMAMVWVRLNLLARELNDKFPIDPADHERFLQTLETEFGPQDPRTVRKREIVLRIRRVMAANDTRHQIWDQAAEHWARTIQLEDDNPNWHAPRRAACRKLAATPQLWEAVAERLPIEKTLWIGRAQHHAYHLEWPEAAEAYRKAVPNLHLSDSSLFEYAGTLLILGEHEAYQSFCQELVSARRAPTNMYSDANLSRICSQGPAQGVPVDALVDWTRQVCARHKEAWWTHMMGLACYRAERYPEAIRLLGEANAGDWGRIAKAQNAAVLAMVHQRLGNDEEAQRQYALAVGVRDSQLENPPIHPSRVGVPDWISLNVLVREAGDLVGTGR